MNIIQTIFCFINWLKMRKTKINLFLINLIWWREEVLLPVTKPYLFAMWYLYFTVKEEDQSSWCLYSFLCCIVRTINISVSLSCKLVSHYRPLATQARLGGQSLTMIIKSINISDLDHPRPPFIVNKFCWYTHQPSHPSYPS